MAVIRPMREIEATKLPWWAGVARVDYARLTVLLLPIPLNKAVQWYDRALRGLRSDADWREHDEAMFSAGVDDGYMRGQRSVFDKAFDAGAAAASDGIATADIRNLTDAEYREWWRTRKARDYERVCRVRSLREWGQEANR